MPKPNGRGGGIVYAWKALFILVCIVFTILWVVGTAFIYWLNN